MVEGWLRHPSEAWPYEALKRGLPRPFKLGEGKNLFFISLTSSPYNLTWGANFFIFLLCRSGETGRRTGLKIPRGFHPMSVRFRPPAPIF